MMTNQPSTLLDICNKSENAYLKQGLDIFLATYFQITRKLLDIPDTPIEFININTVLGREIEPSIGKDLVLFDLYQDNTRTLLYYSNVPGADLVTICSGHKRYFSQAIPMVHSYVPETNGGEQDYRNGIKQILTKMYNR